jgi:hypothetical protein
MPEEYVSPLAWDGVDNMLFRPLSDFFAVKPEREAINVNSLDEVPDSAWFTNRIGVRPFTLAELERGACRSEQMLDPENAPEGSWLIDQGKPNGASPGFRVKIPGKGKYMLKSDAPGFERPSAASVIGAAVYHAAGFYTSCEQIIYIRRSILKLKPGLRYTANFGGEKDFDEKALAELLARTPKRGELLRFQASAWLPGRTIGPFRYLGTRADDPNDVVPHEHRRELRGGRLLAAWLNHFDAREQNSMDVWMAERADAPDSSPGRVIHYYLDTSDILGSEWSLDGISRRLGHSYVFDFGDVAQDFVTLGIPRRPWDRVRRKPGHEIFGYFDVQNFVPEDWKMEYPNAAFSRMTERDGAWMTRILARFTPEMVRALAALGQWSDPSHTPYLTGVLQGRRMRILTRYLTRVSPITDVVLAAGRLCGVDLARQSGVGEPRGYRYSARVLDGPGLAVVPGANGRVCVALPPPSSAAGAGYLRIRIENGRARGPLLVHLYDRGEHGYYLAGLERPEE